MLYICQRRGFLGKWCAQNILTFRLEALVPPSAILE